MSRVIWGQDGSFDAEGPSGLSTKNTGGPPQELGTGRRCRNREEADVDKRTSSLFRRPRSGSRRSVGFSGGSVGVKPRSLPRPVRGHNEDGLESAKPDLQSTFKKPGGDPASPRPMGNASRQEGGEQAQAERAWSSK